MAWNTIVPCSDLLPGHRHCRHGHTKDCPDPGECELLPEPVTDVEPGTAAGWRWVTFAVGQRRSVTLRELTKRVQSGDWTLTEHAQAAARNVSRSLCDGSD